MSASEGHVLSRVLNRIAEERRSGHDPVVVFDLDHTLFDNGPRVHAILVSLAKKYRERTSVLLERLGLLRPEELPFDFAAVLSLLGIEEGPFRNELRGELAARFFSSRYLDRDVPLPGARDFVLATFEAGATIVYLTGRDSIDMEQGTLDSLRTHGFPVDQRRAHLIMKPDQITNDVAFKATARERIAHYGSLVAFFDNEPGNVNNFKEAFPSCIAVLLETKHSPEPPPVKQEIERIKDFLLGGAT